MDFSRGVSLQTEIRPGRPVDEIRAAARQLNMVDLIVTSTHGRTGFKQALIGSVAEHVVRYAEGPVLVVPSRSAPNPDLDRPHSPWSQFSSDAFAFWAAAASHRFSIPPPRKNWPVVRKIRRDHKQRCLFLVEEEKMNSTTPSNGNWVRTTKAVVFKFQDLEITRNALVIRFFEEKTVIPLKEIESYHLKWYLHDPTFAKKYWFLVLTVELKNGEEESGPIAVAKFNYLDDQHQLRQHIRTNIARAIDLAVSWRGAVRRKINRSQQDRPRVTRIAATK